MISGEVQALIHRLGVILEDNPIELLWSVYHIYRVFKCLNTPVGIDFIRTQNKLWSIVIRKACQLTDQLDERLNLLGGEITPELHKVSQIMKDQIKQVVSQL